MNHVNYDCVLQQNCDLDHKKAIFLHSYVSRFVSMQKLQNTVHWNSDFAEDSRNDRTSGSKRAETDWNESDQCWSSRE